MSGRSRGRLLTALTALALCAGLVPAAAQVFHVVPEKAIFFRKAPCPLAPQDVQPCGVSGNIADCLAVRPPDRFGTMRAAVRVERGAQPNWRLRVRDAVHATVLEEIPLDNADAVLWTDELPSHGAIVELLRPTGATGGRLGVERLDCAVERAFEQAVVGVNGLVALVELTDVHKWIKELGRSVARLRFMTPLGEGTCTGFLVAADVLMTNEHCINSQERARSMIAEFGYDAVGARVERFRGEALLDVSPLDYSLVRLRGKPGTRWGVLALDAGPSSVALDLVIIQHPLGGHKQVSIEHCIVSGLKRVGSSSIESDFEHGCDTLSGSSGSPVIDMATKKVIGLHHFGFLFDDKPAVNQAVDAGRLPRVP